MVSVNPFKNVGCVGKAIRNRYKKGGAQNAQLLTPTPTYAIARKHSERHKGINFIPVHFLRLYPYNNPLLSNQQRLPCNLPWPPQLNC